MNKTILKFDKEEEAFEVIDKDGRPVDPVELSETLDDVNNQIGRSFYNTDINDIYVDGDDVSVVTVSENEGCEVTEKVIEEALESFDALLADKGWYREDAPKEVVDEIEAESEESDEGENGADFDDDENGDFDDSDDDE